jgi:hypothetical protein
MADAISAQTVTEVWQDMAQTHVRDASKFVEQMKDEQPVVLGFLLYLDDFPFNQYEREIVFYLGMVVWQMMKQSKSRLRKVTRKKLEKAEETNYEMLSFLASDTDADFMSATRTMLEKHREPEVLRYIVEAIMEEDDDPDDPPIRDEYRGLAFVHLKIALDAFIDSLAPQ